MPKLLDDMTEDQEVFKIPGTSFTFSGIRPDKLGATEYTLVTLVIDITGSVDLFSSDLLKMLKEVIRACKKHPRKDNLMVRVVTFNRELYELHPFKPIVDIDENSYNNFVCNGCTALFDATLYAIGASQTYAESLSANDLDVNAAVFVITDGEDNASKHTEKNIKKALLDIKAKEALQSILTVLIGINSSSCKYYLEHFKDNAGLSQYVDVQDATPSNLAKLGGFISQSVSSSSQALASKTPSVPISATF